MAPKYSEATGRFRSGSNYSLHRGDSPAKGKGPAPLPEESDSDKEDNGENGSSEDESDGDESFAAAADTLLGAVAAVADDDDALDEGEKWHVGQEVTQPLSFLVPTDTNGGAAVHTFTNVHYDMNDPARVDRANKSRLQKIRRAKTELGLPLARDSMKGREFTQANDDFIRRVHVNYAANHNGRAVPLAELVRQYQAQYPTENRTYASIATHIERRQAVKNMRLSYSK